MVDDKILGTAKRDIKKGEEFLVPILDGGILGENETIDFVSGITVGDLI